MTRWTTRIFQYRPGSRTTRTGSPSCTTRAWVHGDTVKNARFQTATTRATAPSTQSQRRSMSAPSPGRRSLRLRRLAAQERLEGQVRHRLLAGEIVHHDLLRRRQDALHGFQVETAARDVLRLGVLLLQRGEALRGAGGLAHLRLAVGLGLVRDLRRLPARARHHVVGIAARLVDEALLVLLRADDVLEGVRHLVGGTHVLELDGDDLEARAVEVEDALQHALSFDLDVLLAFGEHLVDRRTTDHLAHRGLRRRAHRPVGITGVEQEVGHTGRVRPHLVLDDELELHDVLVAGQHERLGLDVLVAGGRTDLDRAEAELLLANRRDARPEPGFGGPGGQGVR